jgi:WD40 repeat protein
MKTKKKKQTENPEIYAIRKGNKGVDLERRDLLKYLGAFTGATLVGCNDINKKVISDALGEPAPIPQTINAEACNSLLAHSNGVLSVSYSPDGKILASGSLDNKIKLWSIPEGKLQKTLEGHSGGVSSVSFSNDGKILASGSADNTIKLWSVTNSKIIKTLEGHSGSVEAVCFSPDGKILASGSDDMTIRLWSVPEGNLLKTLTGHTDIVETICFSPDGKTLASGSKATIVKLWSVPEGVNLKTLEVSNDNAAILFSSDVRSVCFSPDGKILVSTSGNSIILWSLPEGKLLRTLSEHADVVYSVSLSPDGKILASGSTDRTIKLWSMPDGKIQKTMEGHTDTVCSVCFHPKDNMLASGSSDKTIKLWQWNSYADIETNDFYQEGFTNLIPPFAGSGNYIAVNSRPYETDKLQILDLKTNAVIYSIRTNTIAKVIALQADAKFVLIGDSMGTIKWWNLENTKEKSTFSAHEGRISGIIIKKNNKEFITAGEDGKIKIWSFPENKCLKILDVNSGPINGIVLSHDEKMLLVYSDTILQLWSLESFTLIKSSNEIQRSKFEGNKRGSLSEDQNNITFTYPAQFAFKSNKVLIGTVNGFIVYDYVRDVL